MTDYSNFEVEDFLHDDFFIDWVLKGTQQDFWDQWLLKHPDRKIIVEKAHLIISAIVVQPLKDELTDADVNSIAAYVHEHGFTETIEPNIIPLKFHQTKWFRFAALFLAFVTAGLIFSRIRTGNNLKEQSLVQVTDPYLNVINNTRQTRLVRMNDGSLAVLKPGSGLKYLKTFKSKREVFLDGEAFFEIHKNPSMPFLVHSHDMIVRVLGTSFTVKSFNHDQEFKVIVNTGKVLVYNQKAVTTADKQKYTVTLIPNQQVIYEAKASQVTKETLTKPLTLSKEIAQKEFTFDNAPLSVIIEKIEKAYDVNIEYDKTKLGNINLTASLSDRPLDEKVKLICKAVNVSCQFVDGRIIIDNPNHIPTN
ncbi:FecR family protein [Mucilaginibacter sabulilitoris]|uniref:FecR family protein n=1 Tax=Mucilaginibacter sabulilitoris TaxID=1173583 RepID=A0ABZ0TII7_9SPHI|nr:FecR family protein [Mucilaginibacter sabulilitoris]WPU91534.1 FecR family protein [Mucilaginibacter sabulilitoris]